ncbi:MAG: DUF5856 family protein [Bacteroidales bacterium]|jgi:DNA-binding ferritin-like protein|nr:DUF5856 family protein [Bacteroidales bacterium]
MEKKKNTNSDSTSKVGKFFGNLYSFNSSLKLYHWHVTGPGSYAEHMALDQAIDELSPSIDSIVETSYAMFGDIEIIIPETKLPKNIIKHAEDFYKYIEDSRDLFKENFSLAICDNLQQAIQQLLYRLKRLK